MTFTNTKKKMNDKNYVGIKKSKADNQDDILFTIRKILKLTKHERFLSVLRKQNKTLT